MSTLDSAISIVTPSLPFVAATTPTTVPPTSTSITYDRWWLTRLTLDASNPGEVVLTARMDKYAVIGGSVSFSPVDPPAIITIPDVLTLAATDANIGSTMGALLQGIQVYGRPQGLI